MGFLASGDSKKLPGVNCVKVTCYMQQNY